MRFKQFSLYSVINFLLPVSLIFAQPVSPMVPVLSGTPQSIGIVAAVRGTVQITSQGQVGKVAGSGQPVFLGDTVSTDEKGSLQILLLDQTVFTIGPNSSIVIDKFVYDPATHDGVVKAKVVKGVFRFVTGKIGQKKPQQMEVELPAGTIGIRGTIVAGEVAGQRSKVILLGPGEKNNTGHREGKFTLSNESNGQLKQETVSKTGFGSIIDGDGAAPSKPFQIPAEDLARITNALGPIPVPDPGAQGPQGSDSETGEQNASPTEQAGQGKVNAGESADQARVVGRMMQRLMAESNQNAQRVLNAFFEIKDGPTSRDQLQAAGQKIGGIHHFEKTGVVLSGTQNGTANFYVDIDFGGRRVGGGASRVNGTLGGGATTFQYNLGTRAFGVGQENAGFNFPSVPLASGTCSNCNIADIDIGVNNRGGTVAADANVGIAIKVSANSAPTSSGAGLAPRVDGATPP